MLFIPTTLIDSVNNQFTVSAIDRHEVFAGRLGNRVEETLVLTQDGKTVTVKLSPEHTFFGNVKSFKVGQIVTWNGRSFLGEVFRSNLK